YLRSIGKKCGVGRLAPQLHESFRGTTGLGEGGPAASAATRRESDGHSRRRGPRRSREHGPGMERRRPPAVLPDQPPRRPPLPAQRPPPLPLGERRDWRDGHDDRRGRAPDRPPPWAGHLGG